MQRQANITEPDYGALLADMFYGDGAEIPVSRFIQPRLECELGFVIGRRLKGPICTIFDVLSATDYVIPPPKSSMGEPIGSTRKRQAALCAGQHRRQCRQRRPDRRRPADAGPWKSTCAGWRCCCHRNNVIEESGVAAAVLNHPANGVAWLANKLAPFDIALEPGQFVLGGSFTSTVEARAGDVSIRLRPARIDLQPIVLGSAMMTFGIGQAARRFENVRLLAGKGSRQ